MGKLIKALKKLGLKINGNEPSGKYVSDVIDNVANDFENGNTATKDYVNQLMSGALKRTIVEALPETNIDTNTIYMVLDESASQQGNVYNEYLYINNAWELIGTTAIETTKTYTHNIKFTRTQGYTSVFVIEIVDNDPTPFTEAKLRTINGNIMACGYHNEANYTGVIYGFYIDATTAKISVNNTTRDVIFTAQFYTFEDNVREL